MNPSQRTTDSSLSCRRTLLTLLAVVMLHVLSTCSALAQGSTAVEALGNVPASQLDRGLGFTVNPQNEWEFQMAAAAGGTTVRFQCGWDTTEIQSAPPYNESDGARFALSTSCQSGLTLSKKYGMRPTVVAAYGAPFHAILQLSFPDGARAGSTSVDVQLVSGVGGDTLESIHFPFATIITANRMPITRIHSYAGGLITGVRIKNATHATLTLASAIKSDLPADPSRLYTINEYLYPPPETFSPTDPSVLAFARYAEFLANSMAAQGVKGEIEIWNEPPWPDDPWDERADFYDVFPGTSGTVPQAHTANFGFVAAIQAQTSPAPGVTYVWSGTEKSGDGSLYASMKKMTGVDLTQPTPLVTAESIHPYADTPENSLWLESCLKASIRPNPATPKSFWDCNLTGPIGGNAARAEQLSLVHASSNPGNGLRREITETGFPASSGDQQHKARYVLRQYLAYQAQGVTPIEFYRMWDLSYQDWGFATQKKQGQAPITYPAYDAISGLMADVAAIKRSPVAPYSDTTLPTVQSYSGTYPLSYVHVVGAKAGDRANSVLMALWQRSHGPKWGTIPSPNAAPAKIQIPSGLAVSKVINLSTRSKVNYQLANQILTLYVSDDPVEIMLVPVSASAVAITSSASSVVVGGSVALSCTATLVDGTHGACTSPSYTSSDTTITRMQGNVGAAEGVGSSTLTVTDGGQSASTVVTVTPATPAVQFGAITSKTSGEPAFPVSATSGSFGAMSYSVLSGPASVSGRMVQTLGAGNVVLRATQAPEGNYSAGQAQTSFMVANATVPVSLVPGAMVVSAGLALPDSAIHITKTGKALPTGTVEILDGSAVIWRYTIPAGNHGNLGGITIPPMSAGQHSLKAYYLGDAIYGQGMSAPVTVTVTENQAHILASCSKTQLAYGEPLSCVITGTEGAAPLTGVVNYTAGGVAGSAGLNAAGQGTIVAYPPKGKGTLMVRYAAQGSHPTCPYPLLMDYMVD